MQKSESKNTYKIINPSNEEVITEVQHGTKADINKAVNAALEAFEIGSSWRKMDASERGNILFKIADLIERDASYLAVSFLFRLKLLIKRSHLKFEIFTQSNNFILNLL